MKKKKNNQIRKNKKQGVGEEEGECEGKEEVGRARPTRRRRRSQPHPTTIKAVRVRVPAGGKRSRRRYAREKKILVHSPQKKQKKIGENLRRKSKLN